jgi:hypothetical protein
MALAFANLGASAAPDINLIEATDGVTIKVILANYGYVS